LVDGSNMVNFQTVQTNQSVRWVQCKYPWEIMEINWLLDTTWDLSKSEVIDR